MKSAFLVLVGAALIGCQNHAAEGVEMGGVESDAGPDAQGFHGPVEAIFQRACQGCHREGGAAPFQLTDYDGVAARAGQIRAAVMERTMPPFFADPSGDCQEFRHGNWLTEEEIDLVAAWVDAGAPQGDPELALPPPKLEEGLTDATHTLAMAESYAPVGDGSDDYRCFVVDPQLAADAFVTAFEVEAGVASQVHHVIVYTPTSEEAAEKARALDAEQDGYGYECFGAAGSGVGVNLAVAWAPGSNVNRLPEGTGVRMPAGRPYVVQVHYNLAGGDAPDLSKVHLKLEEEVDHEVVPFFLAHLGINLEPGRETEVEQVEYPLDLYLMAVDQPELASGDIDLYGVAPHMHKLGARQQLERVPAADDDECLLRENRWDFNWQFAYYFDEPVRLSPATDKVRMTCVYDTSDETEPVRWGDGTSEEMCLMVLYAAKAG